MSAEPRCREMTDGLRHDTLPAMPPDALKTAVKLAIASLIVGLALSFFGVTPQALLHSFGRTVVDIYDAVLSFLTWAIKYVLIGAVVVVPIWIAAVLWRLASRKR